MEPLTIISLVGNIVQFLEFGGQLVSKSAEIYRSGNGAVADVADTETATIHLRRLNEKLKNEAINSRSSPLSELCTSCGAAADQLLAALEKVKVKNKNSKWQSVRKALRTIWAKDEITELESRLARFRAELNLHINVDIRDQILQFKQEKSNEFKDLDLVTKKIMDAIIDQHDVFSNALNIQVLLMTELLQDMRVAQSPSSNVPFRRDPDFVDRRALLAEIQQKCSTPAGRAALVGLGGVGKSQLAIEYSYRVRESEVRIWVFWIHAGTAARFEEGYKAIADRVKLPGRDKPKVDILRLVHQWLCDEQTGKWLLILDNADDATIFFNNPRDRRDSNPASVDNSPAPILLTYLPQSSNGSILITTRVDDVAFRLIGKYEDVIKVEQMDPDHALALLQTKIGDRSNEQTERELIEALEYMPLAISQAAAYIRQRTPRSSVAKYLRDFLKSEHIKSALLNHDAGDLRRDPSASNSVTITWYISFDHIRLVRPSAADLLSLMSFFDQQDIPEYLLRREKKLRTDCRCNGETDGGEIESSSDTDDDDSDFEEDIVMLRNYSLIGMNKTGDAFKMHSLVQLSTRRWLEDNGQLERWKEQFITKLSQEFPTAEFHNWGKCQRLFAHAEAVRKQRPVNRDALETWAVVLHNAGWYAMAQGNLPVAARMTEKAMATREMVLGNENPSTLASANNLALLRRYQGNYEQAENISTLVLVRRQKVLGKNHFETLTSANNLASMLKYRGRYGEAEDLHRGVLEEREKLLGKEHQDTLASMNNLALLLRYQGKYAEAEIVHRQGLAGTEKALGEMHPDTLRNVSKLATVLRYQGKYEESEMLHRRAIEGYEKVLGKDHPDTLTSVSKLGVMLGDLGMFDEAETKMQRALAGRERILGKKHPSTIASVANLASVLQKGGRFSEAESMSRRAMEGREALLGKRHPDTMMSTYNLALILQDQADPEEAEVLHRRALNGRDYALGQDHPDTVASVHSLAALLGKQKQYKEASELYKRAASSYSTTLGQNHEKAIACNDGYKNMRKEMDSGSTVANAVRVEDG